MAATANGSFRVRLTATVGDKIVISVDDGPARIALVVGDTDGDGLSDADEATQETNPDDPDTDGDGFPDGLEVAADSNRDPRGAISEYRAFPPGSYL
jgi:hypothetical protein